MKSKKHKAEIVNCVSSLGSLRGKRNWVLKEEKGVVLQGKEGQFEVWEIEEKTQNSWQYGFWSMRQCVKKVTV